MSRLCVKNLPAYVDAAALRKHFESAGLGPLTDAKVLRSKSGKSRGLAFIGFTSEASATRAQKYFHKSFFDTRKLSVELALPVGDTRLARPWSKRSSSDTDGSFKPSKQGDSTSKAPSKDKRLQEFLALMQPRSKKHFWADDLDHDHSSVNPLQAEAIAPGNDNETDPTVPGKEPRRDTEVEAAAESGRLFVRNVAFQTTESALRERFEAFGPVTEVSIPVDDSGRSKGFAFVLFLVPEHASKALAGVDGTIFQGRLLHVIPALSQPRMGDAGKKSGSMADPSTKFKKAKAEKQKREAGDSRNWNALFVRADAAVSAVAKELGVMKGDLFDEDAREGHEGSSAAVRVALSETRVIEETKRFLGEHGVDVALLEKGVRDPTQVMRSETVLLLKNVPHDANQLELKQMFAAFGSLERFVMPPSKTMALVAFHSNKDAKKAFQRLAYKRYKRVPIYLEFAPDNCLKQSLKDASITPQTPREAEAEEGEAHVEAKAEAEEPMDESSLKLHTLYVKNLSFDTTEDALRKHFEKLLGQGAVKHVSIPTKANNKNLSMGFGFVECVDQEATRRGLRISNGSTLDGHILGVTLSKPNPSRTTAMKPSKRKRTTDASVDPPDTSATKLVVRNLAFEANKKELKQLFASFGHINSVRLPKKFDGTHRGFAFIDFVTHEEAKSAFKALAATHLYGRKLVLEWAQDTKNMATMLHQN